ncbi:ras GTPase-activating protein 1-like isoform X2 [Ptychodera flava]|uniref:ras GTPase-activating protein 1-like isoform X2 n=1 Tax=Ptychodera flava TaxID=63121 RepID=UPI00396A52FB
MAANCRGSINSHHYAPLNRSSEELQDLTIHDEFDPFEGGSVSFDETVDINSTAPPENEWYHGKLDRHTAEERLYGAGRSGSYLIRESDRRPGSYVLSYLGNTGINHFKITAVCGDYYIGSRQFDSLSGLISWYSSISCILKDEKLLHAVPPPEPVDDRRRVVAILPYNGTADTDELSFVKGEVFTVHNALEGGWLWVTSHATNQSGLVVKDLVEEIDGEEDPNEDKEWYHGGISKQEAVELLMNDGDVGSFLIRTSDKNPGDYSMSFRTDDTIQRFRIQKQGLEYLMGGRYYNSLEAIIEHYQAEELVEGYTLRRPVPVKNKIKTNGGTVLEVDSRALYATIVGRNTGSEILSNKSDASVLKGYLNKKSGRTKKWKVLYFVLNGAEQQLYFFENEKRTKPKGLVDLVYSTVYTVHESLFGRPNCFQVVSKGLGDLNIYYLCAESSESMQEWMQTIRQYCSRSQRLQQHSNMVKKGVKELRSLTVHVMDAHKLPVKQAPHPYCVLSLNDVKVARTQVQTGPDPVWNEAFILEDLPDDIESLTLSVYNRNKRTKDSAVCQMIILTNKLPNGLAVEDWYPLVSLQQCKTDMGSVRLCSRFMQETIMPEEEYGPLKELIFSPDLQTIYAFEEMCGKNRSHVASIILKLYRTQRKEVTLLKALNTREIEIEEERSTLFRANTIATTLMDKYMKLTAIPFVHCAVKEVILKILESKQSCELNPLKLEKGMDVNVNCEHLLTYLKDLSESIFSSANFCPLPVRYLCGCLQGDVKRKWPNNVDTHSRVVSGFIFLRLICPAILNPRQFNIASEPLSDTAARTLTIVAKAIQNLANLVEFGAKEPYMEALNPFIVLNKGRMIRFLEELSNVDDWPEINPPMCTDLSRDLAALHQLSVSHMKDLQRLSTSKPHMKKLQLVTKTLMQKQKQYMGETT